MKIEREGLKKHYTGVPADYCILLEKLKYVRTHISDRGKLELLAEEAAELSQAALKMCRLLGDNVGDTYPVNPDKYNVDICNENLVEEMVDVLICMDIIYDRLDISQYWDKVNQMFKRINEAEEDDVVEPDFNAKPYTVQVDSRCDATKLLLSLQREAAKNGGFVTIDDLNVLTGKDSLIYDTQWGWTKKMLRDGYPTWTDVSVNKNNMLVLPQPIFRDSPFKNN